MATCYFLWCHHRKQVAFGARGSGRCGLSQGKILVFDRGYMDCERPLEFGQARGSSRGAPERKRRLLDGGGTPASEWAGMVIKNARHLFVLFSSERIKLLPCQLGVLPGFTIHASNLSPPSGACKRNVHHTNLSANWISLPGVVVEVRTPAVDSGAPVASKMSV